MRRTFDTLRQGAPARLAKLRADAAKLAANPHRNMHVAANPFKGAKSKARMNGDTAPYFEGV